MAKTYWEKLKDPRWQKKRLEALQSADFKCQACYDSEQTLHVHHKQYFKGREPWEYEVMQLAVLCESCHSAQHESEDVLNLTCSYLPVYGPFSRETIAALVSGYARLGKPVMAYDPFAYYAGMLCSNIFAINVTNIHDLIELAELSQSDAKNMMAALLACANTQKSSVTP